MLFGHQNMMFTSQLMQTVTLPSVGQINHKNLAFKTSTRLLFFFHFLSILTEKVEEEEAYCTISEKKKIETTEKPFF
jgi:hypothetical protein